MNRIKPLITRRFSTGYRAEVALSPGPIAEADTGRGTLADTFGRAWMLYVERLNGRFRLFREHGGEWVEVYPIDPLPVDRDAAHVSLAFDQNGRPVIAWVRGGMIYVWAWDDVAQHYAVRYSWPGLDPVLYQDAFTTGDIANSDVVAFYVEPDRSMIAARVQREQYRIAHALYSGEALGLDQVYTSGARVILYGEEAGQLLAVQTDLYPLAVVESFDAPAVLSSGHRYERDIYGPGAVIEALDGSSALAGTYISQRLISVHEGIEALDSPSVLAGKYQMVRLISEQPAQDELGASANFAGDYSYTRDIYTRPDIIEALDAPAILGGVYREA